MNTSAIIAAILLLPATLTNGAMSHANAAGFRFDCCYIQCFFIISDNLLLTGNTKAEEITGHCGVMQIRMAQKLGDFIRSISGI